MSQKRLGRTFSFAFILAGLAAITFGHYPNHQTNACSNRLENALEHMVQRNRMKSGSRTYLQLTPYSVYQSLYGEQENILDDQGGETILNEKLDTFATHDRKESPITRVEVADLRVRLPHNMRWVLVDRCHFIAPNRTLDTRLMFPDLTISGKVILHPLRGKCNMILRLRRAGIEFRTIPLTSNEESRRNGVASVRTDSHFAEPGFLSVFAHGCQAPSGQKFRQNSKRRHMKNEPRYLDSHSTEDYKYRGAYREPIDTLNFDDSILDTDVEVDTDRARTFTELFGLQQVGGHKRYQHRYPSNQWYNAEPLNTDDEVTEALTRDLEQLFSMGVRGLLTTYMQKALQPAIKETLMENMGYTISYG